MKLEPYLTHGPWLIAMAVGLPVLAKVVLSVILTRGAQPPDKAALLRAVGDMFRSRRG